MYSIKYVFTQITSFLDRNHFNYLVRKYKGDRYVKSFTCWNQLLVLMFGQLCQRKSLRDLSMAIGAHKNKLFHLGFGKGVTHKEPVFSVLNCQLKDGLYGPYVFYNDSDKTFVVTYFSVEDNNIGREFRVTGIPNKFARTMKMLYKAAVLSSTYGKLSIWSSEASSYHISFHGMEAYYLSFDSDFYGRKYPLFSNSREGEKIPELFSIIDRVFILFEEGETEKLNELIPRMKALTRRFRGYYTK